MFISDILKDAKSPISTDPSDYRFLSFCCEEDGRGDDLADTPNGSAEFSVRLPRETGGEVVSAVDFGMNESNNDCGTAINNALEYCRKVRASKLVLAKGVFRCFGSRGIVIRDLHDFTLDGCGANLVFRRESDFSELPQYAIVEENANILIRDCRRVMVGNFSMDWDWETDPLGAFVRVIDKHVDEDGGSSYFDVEFIGYDQYTHYGKKIPISVIAPMNDDLDGFSSHGNPMFFGPSEGHYGTKSEWLSPNTLRVFPSVKPEDVPLSSAYDHLYGENKNRTEAKYFAIVGKTYRIMHYYYGKNGMNMESNENLTLEGIDILSCRGMGIHVDGSQKYWQVRNLNVVPPPDALPRRPCTTTADVYHFARSCGFCKLIGCHFSLNQDDIINFHDRSTFVRKVSQTRVEVANQRGMYYFRAHPEDTLELLSGDGRPLGFSAKIVSIEGETMELDQPVPGQNGDGFLAADRSYGTSNIIIRDCTFRNYYGRVIITGSNTTIENCLFQNGTSIPLRVCMVYTFDKWSEGSGCSNTVVRNCTFDNNNINLPSPDGLVSDMFFGARVDPASGFGKPSRCVVSDVLVEGNTFRNIRGLPVLIGSGENVVFRDNAIQQDGEVERARSYCGSIFVRNAARVSILGNRFQLAGVRNAGIVVDKSDTVGIAMSGNTATVGKKQPDRNGRA